MTSAKFNILYICQNALGDVITTLPSIQFLRQSYPHATLDVCINGAFTDIFSAEPNVDRVIPAPAEWFDTNPDSVREVRVERLQGFRPAYDVAIDSMGTPQTGQLISLLQPSKSIGIGFSDPVPVYDLTLPLQEWRRWGDGTKNVVECFGDLPRILVGDFKDSAPVLHVTKEAQEWGQNWISDRGGGGCAVVAFNPGAGNFMKRWPIRNFIEVAKILRDNGCLPLFVFGPKEAELNAMYREEIVAMDGLVYYSEDSRSQPLAGILRGCKLLVSNDCGVMHVGASVGCHVLAIFGPSVSRIWFPYSKDHNRVIERDVNCRLGCKETCTERPCLTSITPEEVALQAIDLLQNTTLGRCSLMTGVNKISQPV